MDLKPNIVVNKTTTVHGLKIQSSLQIKFYFYCYNIFKSEQKIWRNKIFNKLISVWTYKNYKWFNKY